MTEQASVTAAEGALIEVRNGVAVITLRNPGRRNAFYPEMRQQVIDALMAYNNDPSVRVVVITGADGHFCAGADLKRVTQRGDLPPLQIRDNMITMHALLRLLAGGQKPVIAAVEGDAFGAGLSMAVACDFVVASETARFGASFGRMGLFPDMGLVYTLPQRMGATAAKQFMLLSEPIGGAQAVERKLADELAPAGEALPAALALAKRLTASAPMSMAYIKSVMARGVPSVEAAIDAERDLVPLLATSEDHKAAIGAFHAKRPFSFASPEE
jgi:2-(1,2-epoxy-1,2-dihydrophenyl)acetyl-CoA isomerase